MRRQSEESDETDQRIMLGEVAEYLGVGRRVVSRLVKEGVIKVRRDPLDHRRKLVSVYELNKLKKQSLKTS